MSVKIDDLEFFKVETNDNAVHDIYDIINKCGQDMYENQGLVHWKDPYPLESIKKNCVKIKFSRL